MARLLHASRFVFCYSFRIVWSERHVILSELLTEWHMKCLCFLRVSVFLLPGCLSHQFDITIDKVFGTKPGGHYVVKWSRGVKVAATKPVSSTKEAAGKAGLSINQKISLLVTLYREEGKRFDVKDAKLSLVAVNPGKKQERTAAKTHFDLSVFAGVPSASTAKVFKLSDKVSIHATVDSRFVKAGASGPGSAGASSAMSGMTGVSGQSSDDDDGEDDFDDLALDDIPEPELPTASSARSKKTSSESRVPGSVQQSRVPLLIETPRRKLSSSTNSEKRKPLPPLQQPATDSPMKGNSGSAVRMKREKSNPNTSVEEVTVPQRAEDEAKIAKLLEENEHLSGGLRNSRKEYQSMQDAHRRQIVELNTKIEQLTQEAAAAVSARASADALLSDMSAKRKELQENANARDNEFAALKRERDVLEAKSKSLSKVEEKNRELSRELDRLALAAATVKTDERDGSAGNSEVENRMIALRRENEKLHSKLTSHEAHSAQVRTTYKQLSQMYNDLREHNVVLQSEIDKLKEEERQSLSEVDGREELLAQLEDARQEVCDIEASKNSLQSDHDRLLSHVTSLQDRVENTSVLLEESQREVEDLCVERDELKGQRDMAMQRALSRGKSGSGSENSSSRSIGRVEEEVRISKDKYEREQARLTRRILELESEIADLKEDIEYEKNEKLKARDDRDKIRENARELERKTSHAAKQTDAMHSLRRQLSTHQMREEDHESMISDLRTEVNRLQHELDSSHANSNHQSSSTEDVGEVLQELVATKLALAQAEEDKLNTHFSMKKLKKSEKVIQQRLAAHASRLEVKLGEANEELERLRKQSRLEDAREFNELGSDVDY